MSNTLLGISPEYLYIHDRQPKLISDFHKPYFLVFCPKNRDINSARKELLKKIEENKSDENTLSKIESIGEVEEYRSFWDFSLKRMVFKVYSNKSYFVPEISDNLFFYHGLFTAEHDIPYHQRALVDLAAENKAWVLDSNGEKKKLKILV
jgi:DNA polymerase elongation subunit (family B)